MTPDPAEALAEAARGLVYQTDTRGPKVAMCVERIRRELAAFDAARAVRECELEVISWAVYACQRHVRCHTATEPFEADLAEHEEVQGLFEMRKSVAKLLAARNAKGAQP